MRKILVIEDEKIVRLNIVKLLEFEGFKIFEAENGEEGIRFAKEFTPDLIVCDIMMPVINGFDVQTELRQDSATRTIPFIFLTAKAERADMRLGMNLGADDYLTKPFSRDELLETIFSHLDKQDEMHQIFQENAERVREDIMSSLPSDIFVPLQSIRSFFELLHDQRDAILPPKTMLKFDQSYESILKLEHSLQNYFFYNLLTLAQNDERQAAALKGDCVTKSDIIIHEIANQQAIKYNRASDISLNLESCDLPLLEANFVKIIEELIDNALKFSPVGSKVQITSLIQNERMSLKILNEVKFKFDSNNPPIQIAQVGETGGSGMGLAIAERLITLHEGELLFECAPEAQTTLVHIDLPLASQKSLVGSQV